MEIAYTAVTSAKKPATQERIDVDGYPTAPPSTPVADPSDSAIQDAPTPTPATTITFPESQPTDWGDDSIFDYIPEITEVPITSPGAVSATSTAVAATISPPIETAQPGQSTTTTTTKPRVSHRAKLDVEGDQPMPAANCPPTPVCPTSSAAAATNAPQRDIKDFMLPIKRYANDDPNIDHKRKFASGKVAFLWQGFPVMKFGYVSVFFTSNTE